ncbi:sexual development protein [Whalleya microplaca]|nr:sexual development protein [Whalleya microplaca]
MLTSKLAGLTAIFRLISAYAIPSDDGFPNPNSQQLLDIEKHADGLLSNLPPPPRLSQAGIQNFQLIAFNENFEVGYFSSLVDNITNHVDGFTDADHANLEEILEILKTVKAQEELHALTAISTLKQFNASLVPEPCTYKFPTTSLKDAINLAETFTSLVLGTLQDAEQSFAQNGDDGPVRAISSVIGQEGEQNGFYRIFLGRKPSQKPFLTTSTAAFAFSALQQFIESCPFEITDIDIPIFPPLNVLTTAEAKDMTLAFSADLSSTTLVNKTSNLFITYIVGQQLPISEPISNAKWDGSVLKFNAEFPFTENIMQGFSIAALTNSSNFTDADAVVANTIAAPGLIQVNDVLHTNGSRNGHRNATAL